MPTTTRPPITIAGTTVNAGRRAEAELPFGRLVTGSRVSMPILIVHGRHDGPTLWCSAAIHGDEIGGVEIIRRVLDGLDPRTLRGTLLAVPIVNVHGFLNGDRYLPDRRDLNRSFPGSARGSLASQLAHLLMTEVVQRCEVGIDLHTGSDHRTNLPQIRADLDDPKTRQLAEAFGAPLMIHARIRDGSLRAAAAKEGATVLLYEGGEAWRFDEHAIATGVRGVERVMRELDMIDAIDAPPEHRTPAISSQTKWIRATRSGIANFPVDPGDSVSKGDVVCIIHDALGRRLSRLRAPLDGLVIGQTQHPLVNRGDAVVHIAAVEPTPAPDEELSTS